MARSDYSKRFSFKRPARLREQFGDVHGLVEVWVDGKPIGLLNKTVDGYALRDLEGKRLDVTYGIGRVTAAGVLEQMLRSPDPDPPDKD